MADEVAPDFVIKAHDRLPVIEATLGYRGSTNTGPNLLGAGVEVDFIMRAAGDDGLPLAGASPIVKAQAVIMSAATRLVRYAWRAGDTAVPGRYLAEWQVRDPSGVSQTFPLASYHVIDVLEDLDDTDAGVVNP
jgi:hypothetical protein